MTETQQLIRNCLVAATLLPLFSSLLVICFGKRVGKGSAWFAVGAMGMSFVASFVALLQWLGSGERGTIVWRVPWIPLPGSLDKALYLGCMVDGLTIAMMAMVTLISTLVHLYSVGYMAGDKRYERFFGYLSLFTFSMLGIVMSNSVMMIFVFWELVGLTSYLLIGFWFEKRGPQLACKKAFVMNRVGDMGFLIGFGILFYQLGGRVMLPACEGVATDDGGKIVSMLGALTLPAAKGGLGIDILNPPLWLTIAGIGLFFGAIGKSAQFPLHTWLPDAMEGPTPVSSIVHSATMVAAGVYLTGRIYPILTPGAHLFVATIGLITLVIAACMALVMTDIKRVLAYSTLSQLGYMILGLGAGAWAFALYHLITHAFFKCCLFQCAGSVIHAAHHQQDMRYYGGLGRKMPLTMACYVVCTLAIAGASIPYTSIGVSGFYSKDGIIAGTRNYGEAVHAASVDAIGRSAAEANALRGELLNLDSMEKTAAKSSDSEDMAEIDVAVHRAQRRILTDRVKDADAESSSALLMHTMAPLFYWGPTLVAYLTVFYMTRSLVLTFMGTPRDQHLFDHAHEAPVWMLISQLVLAAMAIFSAPIFWPYWLDRINEAVPAVPWAMPGDERQMHHGYEFVHGALLHGLGWILAMVLGWLIYRKGMAISSRIAALPVVRLFYKWFLNKFYFDDFYDILLVALGKGLAGVSASFDKHIVDGLVNLAGWCAKILSEATGLFDNRVVDGAVNGAADFAQNGGQLLRSMQPGRIRVYVLWMFVFASMALLAVVTVVLAGR